MNSPGGSPLTHRLATRDDVDTLRALMEAAIAELQKPFLGPAQIAASRTLMGLDTQLIDDGTYFVVESAREIAGCGGWSRRATLYGGDATPGRSPALLDPARPHAPGEPDPVRPLFVSTWARLAPLLRRLGGSLPGESALQLLGFVAAADAVAALDALGPEAGLELSADGLRRLARLAAPAAPEDPVATPEDVDPAMREIFGFGPAPEEEPAAPAAPEGAGGAPEGPAGPAQPAEPVAPATPVAPPGVPAPEPEPAPAPPGPTRPAPAPPPAGPLAPEPGAPPAESEPPPIFVPLPAPEVPLRPAPETDAPAPSPSAEPAPEEAPPPAPPVSEGATPGGDGAGRIRLPWTLVEPTGLAALAQRLHRYVPERDGLESYLLLVRDVLKGATPLALEKRALPAEHRSLFGSLVLATAWKETCWRQWYRSGREVRVMRSSVGAVGLMQVSPRVWRGFYATKSLENDIAYNARAGAEIVLYYLVEYAIAKGEGKAGGADALARSTYAAYNGGPGHLRRWRNPKGARSLRAIDEAFWRSFQAVKAGRELEVRTCWGP